MNDADQELLDASNEMEALAKENAELCTKLSAEAVTMNPCTTEQISRSVAELRFRHVQEISALGRDPGKYTSGLSIAADVLEALATKVEQLQTALATARGILLDANPQTVRVKRTLQVIETAIYPQAAPMEQPNG